MSQNYELSTQGKIFLICNEGICLNPYLDSVNVKTVLIGATVSEIPYIAKMPWDFTYTIEDALDILDKGLKKYVDAVNSVLDVQITQNQFDSLVSLCYNIGTGNVRKRVGGISGSTVIKRINTGDNIGKVPRNFFGGGLDDVWSVNWITDRTKQYTEFKCLGLMGGGTIADAIMMWNKPSEIIGRRRKEANLFVTGDYGSTKAQLFSVNTVTHKPQYSKSKVVDVAELLK